MSFASLIIGALSSTKYPSTPYSIFIPLAFPASIASGKAWTTPWSVIAIALCPHCDACFTSFLVWHNASIDDICVCAWSSTRFLSALSTLGFLSSSLIPLIVIVSSLLKVSYITSPFILTLVPSLILLRTLSWFKSFKNNLQLIELVLSVTSAIRSIFPFLSSFVSILNISPTIQTVFAFLSISHICSNRAFTFSP